VIYHVLFDFSNREEELLTTQSVQMTWQGRTTDVVDDVLVLTWQVQIGKMFELAGNVGEWN
jgi:hypothetical protein